MSCHYVLCKNYLENRISYLYFKLHELSPVIHQLGCQEVSLSFEIDNVRPAFSIHTAHLIHIKF